MRYIWKPTEEHAESCWDICPTKCLGICITNCPCQCVEVITTGGGG
ncbi:MAG: hypothetical protein ABIM74_03365 [candidate division WOR-3 bacterium]